MSWRIALAGLLAACALPEIRSCPCAEGWTCNAEMRCVRGADVDAGSDVPIDVDAGPSGPVAHFTCDELEGTVMVDASGNGRDARCDAAGCPTLVVDPEREGMVCEFADLGAATGQRLRVSHDDAFTRGAFTVAVWVKPTGTRSGSVIGKPYGTGRANSWQMFLTREADGVSARYVSAFCPAPEDDCPSVGGEMITGVPGAPIPAGDWSHFAIAWDGVTQSAYVDGRETASEPGDIDFDTRDITIGADDNTGVVDLPFPGMVDDIRIYDRALAPDEISALAGVD